MALGGAGRYLIGGADVHVLAEGIALGQRRGAVLHQVERFERPERRQQLLHLQNNSRGRRHEDNGCRKEWKSTTELDFLLTGCRSPERKNGQ